MEGGPGVGAAAVVRQEAAGSWLIVMGRDGVGGRGEGSLCGGVGGGGGAEVACRRSDSGVAVMAKWVCFWEGVAWRGEVTFTRGGGKGAFGAHRPYSWRGAVGVDWQGSGVGKGKVARISAEPARNAPLSVPIPQHRCANAVRAGVLGGFFATPVESAHNQIVLLTDDPPPAMSRDCQVFPGVPGVLLCRACWNAGTRVWGHTC